MHVHRVPSASVTASGAVTVLQFDPFSTVTLVPPFLLFQTPASAPRTTRARRLPAFRPSAPSMATVAVECTICSDVLQVPGSSVTRCGHTFHSECLKRWLGQKRTCPLCKSDCKAGSTRELRAPAPIAAVEEARMRALASAGADPGAVNRQLQSQMRKLEEEIETLWEAREEEQRMEAQKRNAVHRLETELLSLKRELAAAQRMEEQAAEAPASGDEPTEQQQFPIEMERTVSREAVSQQGKQIAWRCQELHALEEKILDVRVPKLARRL